MTVVVLLVVLLVLKHWQNACTNYYILSECGAHVGRLQLG